MRKKAALIAVVLIIVSLFFVFKLNSNAKTVEEAINASGSNRLNIIHEEKHGKGSIVFCYTDNGNALYTALVRKSITGYKTVYDSVHGDIKLVSTKFGLSHSYFPNIEKIGLPVYFGLIGNPDVSEVKIVEKKRGIEKQAKIIETKDSRLWLVYMNGFEGSDFDIKGYSMDGKELIKVDGSIYPYYVEQKPFKGYR